MAVTPAGFRRALGCFATGVAVITVDQGGRFHCMTANAFSSVSLEPPLVLVCVSRYARTHECLRTRARFGVNVLTAKQKPISEYYALSANSRCEQYDARARFFPSRRGTPVLEGSLAFLECSLRETHPAGDHTLFLAQVEEIIPGEGEPLLYFRGKYRTIEKTEPERSEPQ